VSLSPGSAIRRTVAALALAALSGWMLPDAALASTPRAELIRKGDALCARTARELGPLRARAAAARSLPREEQWVALEGLWADQIRIQKRFVARFHAIGLPPNDRRAQRLSDGLDRGVVLAQRVYGALVRRDGTRIPSALRTYLTFTVDLNRRIRDYGFRVCGV
jgi:hypothetical protein